MFFSQAPTYKSQLSNQQSIYKNVMECTLTAPNVDTQEMKYKMTSLAARFEVWYKFIFFILNKLH